jgi:hypothetical protein
MRLTELHPDETEDWPPSRIFLASEALEPQDLRGGVVVVLATFPDRLRAMRGPGESFSDVILRLAKRTTPTVRTKVKR